MWASASFFDPRIIKCRRIQVAVHTVSILIPLYHRENFNLCDRLSWSFLFNYLIHLLSYGCLSDGVGYPGSRSQIIFPFLWQADL